tara:strand:+ start:827 stop:1057 length:231 start_codon:yes stop_codon:yes gene_type:complete
MTKAEMMKRCANYFDEHGHIMSVTEYSEQEDAPIPVRVIKRAFNGSWESFMRVMRHKVDPSTEDGKPLMSFHEWNS